MSDNRFKYRTGDEQSREAAMELVGGDLDGKDFRQGKREFNKQERINKRATRKAKRRGEQLRDGYEGYQQRTGDEQRAGEYFEDLKKGRNKRIAAGVAIAAGTVATAGALGAFSGAALAPVATTAAGTTAAGTTAAGTVAAGTTAGVSGGATTTSGLLGALSAAPGAGGVAASTTGAVGTLGTTAATGTVGTALTTGDKILQGAKKANDIYQQAQPLIDAGIQTYQALQPTGAPGSQVYPEQQQSQNIVANSPYLNASYQQQAANNMGFGQSQLTNTGAPSFTQPAPSYVGGSYYPT